MDRGGSFGVHRRHDGGGRRGYLRMLVGADAGAERGQALRQLDPEGEAGAYRHGGVD